MIGFAVIITNNSKIREKTNGHEKRHSGGPRTPYLCVLCVYECVNLSLFVDHHYQVLCLFPECTRVANLQSLHTVIPGFQCV